MVSGHIDVLAHEGGLKYTRLLIHWECVGWICSREVALSPYMLPIPKDLL